MDQRPDGLPEPLQTYCKEGYCARNVPGKCPQGRSFPDVDLDELPKQEMRSQLYLHGRIPGRDLVKIPWELPGEAGGVFPVLARPESLPVLRRQGQPVNDPKRK